MENRTTNILLVGVGGQGIILASEVMADVFMEAGFDVKKSEVHGMAQRGGSVSTHVRFGPKVFSPLIKEGEVDIFMAFEELEALRYLHYLSPQPTILLNEQRLNPPSVSLGNEVYPEKIPGVLSRHSQDPISHPRQMPEPLLRQHDGSISPLPPHSSKRV
jgi:indolepyruvate ferredoxin oxidoreductase beta subunit